MMGALTITETYIISLKVIMPAIINQHKHHKPSSETFDHSAAKYSIHIIQLKTLLAYNWEHTEAVPTQLLTCAAKKSFKTCESVNTRVDAHFTQVNPHCTHTRTQNHLPCLSHQPDSFSLFFFSISLCLTLIQD